MYVCLRMPRCALLKYQVHVYVCVYLGAVHVWMYDCVDVGVHVKVCTEMNLCIQPKMLGEVGRN